MNKTEKTETAPVIDINTGEENNVAETPATVYKVGDWVYFAFDLVKVNKVDDNGLPTEISDGANVVTAPENTNLGNAILPLNEDVKVSSDIMRNYLSQLQNLSALARLNLGEIIPILIEKWKVLAANLGDKAKVEEVTKELNEFLAQVSKVIKDLHTVKVGNIQLFK